MKNILDIVDIGHQLCVAATAHSLERDFPFAHWESILLLSFDRSILFALSFIYSMKKGGLFCYSALKKKKRLAWMLTKLGTHWPTDREHEGQ